MDGNASERVEVIALSLIIESATNPRKRFDEQALRELAADIEAHGVLNPAIVRPLPAVESDGPEGGVADGYELVCGARRYRASKLAGRSDLPCIVRELTDRQVLEAQVSENGQRDDVHPLEEADAFLALHTTHGVPVEEIAARIGMRPAYVHGRLALARMCDEGREAFLNGKLSTVVAQRIARLPTHDYQRAAVEHFTKAHPWSGDQWTGTEAGQWIQSHYHLRLSDAPFDVTDPTLTLAGACTVCPKNTATQTSLFDDVEASAQCTDPVCFSQKREAAWQAKVAAQVAEGKRVLSADVSSQVVKAFGCEGGYVRANDKPYQHSDGRKTWKQLLGTHMPETVLALAPNGLAVEIIEPEALKKAVKAAGLGKTKVAAGGEKKGKYNDPKLKREPIWLDTGPVGLVEVAAKAALANLSLSDVKTWRFVGALVATQHDPFDVISAIGLPTSAKSKEDVFTRWLTKANATDVLSLLFKLSLSRATEYGSPASDELAATLKSIGVDVAKILKTFIAKQAPPAPEKPLVKKPAPKATAKKKAARS